MSIITQEYALLQISKLHDPAIQGTSLNLTIEYISRFGNWGSNTQKIQSIVSRLTTLFVKIKSARNKILAHTDLEVIMDSSVLGEFTNGLDECYFSALQELADMVHEKWLEGPYPFNDLAGADVDEFLDVLEKAGLIIPSDTVP